MTPGTQVRSLPRGAIALAILFTLAGSLRIAATWTTFNHTIDEPDHLAAGMEWLSAGKYRYEDQHPPLARAFGALGPFLAGERWQGGGTRTYAEGYRILGRNAHYDRTLALGRAGTLAFLWLGSTAVFLWAYRIAGAAGAVAATLLFTTTPAVLAHAGLITTDMALAATTTLAMLVSGMWWREPTRSASAAFGIACGLAALSKFSALAFLPAAWLAVALYEVVSGRIRAGQLVAETGARLRPALMALGTAALVIWAGYLFSFGRIDFLHLRVPAPRFFSGLNSVWKHNSEGHPSYLLGQRSHWGFWYFFPVILVFKTTAGMLLLVAAGLLMKIRRSIAMPAAFASGIILFSLFAHINIGVRHVLPVYSAFAIIGGVAAAALWRTPRLRVFALAAIGWHLTAGALAHPDYLAYTNELAGAHPERILADSDLDWGQDMKRLGEFLRQRHATEVHFEPFNRTYQAAGDDFPRILPSDPGRPSPGWNAVSLTTWKVFGIPAWADNMPPPTAKIGQSILLWYLPR